MEYQTALNYAIASVVVSELTQETKEEVIDALREIESVITGVEFEEGEE